MAVLVSERAGFNTTFRRKCIWRTLRAAGMTRCFVQFSALVLANAFVITGLTAGFRFVFTSYSFEEFSFSGLIVVSLLNSIPYTMIVTLIVVFGSLLRIRTRALVVITTVLFLTFHAYSIFVSARNLGLTSYIGYRATFLDGRPTQLGVVTRLLEILSVLTVFVVWLHLSQRSRSSSDEQSGHKL